MDSFIAMLSFIIAVSAIMTDELLTRVALILGFKETNRLFNFINKKRGEQFAHFIVTLVGIGMLSILLLLFGGELLMFFALALNVPVVMNALVLLKYVSLNKANYRDICHPKKTFSN
jgi:hypothetical protein